MSIFLRIWLAFAVVLLSGAWFTVDALQREIKPSVKQAIEDTLADNANLAAALVADDLKADRLRTPAFRDKIRAMLNRPLRARIWEYDKQLVGQQLYITDARGVVLFDSEDKATGRDYSRWNDVQRTLRGQYGARTTRVDPDDEDSSVMYVAAPVFDGKHIIGVVTLSKTGALMQPFIDRARDRMLKQGVIIVLLALALSVLVAWWLRQAIHAVARHARQATRQRQPLHFLAARELNELVGAIDQMRDELEGRQYVEQYVHTLTHELKSPLAAIQASAELLQDELPAADRLRFSASIHQQAGKLLRLAEHLLLLARLEKQQALPERSPVAVAALVERLLAGKAAQISQRQLAVELTLPDDTHIRAEPFWLEQALANVLDNAIDFTPVGGLIRIACGPDRAGVALTVWNQGAPVPDYALARVFERYYSLPRPDSQRKSTGLGLTLVKEVMALHQGEAVLANVDDGVVVRLMFPEPAYGSG